MPNDSRDRTPDLEAPAWGAFAITPHNTNELQTVTRNIYVGGTGNVVTVMESGEEVTWTAVPTGGYIKGRIVIVKSTGTTATNMLGLY